jgi:hypothetical protein
MSYSDTADAGLSAMPPSGSVLTNPVYIAIDKEEEERPGRMDCIIGYVMLILCVVGIVTLIWMIVCMVSGCGN